MFQSPVNIDGATATVEWLLKFIPTWRFHPTRSTCHPRWWWEDSSFVFIRTICAQSHDHLHRAFTSDPLSICCSPIEKNNEVIGELDLKLREENEIDFKFDTFCETRLEKTLILGFISGSHFSIWLHRTDSSQWTTNLVLFRWIIYLVDRAKDQILTLFVNGEKEIRIDHSVMKMRANLFNYLSKIFPRIQRLKFYQNSVDSTLWLSSYSIFGIWNQLQSMP